MSQSRRFTQTLPKSSNPSLAQKKIEKKFEIEEYDSDDSWGLEDPSLMTTADSSRK